jgi:hypothetical protein
MQTLTKLPTAAPNRKANKTMNQCGINSPLFATVVFSPIIFSSVVPLSFVSVALWSVVLLSVVLQIAPPLILQAKFLSRRTIL